MELGGTLTCRAAARRLRPMLIRRHSRRCLSASKRRGRPRGRWTGEFQRQHLGAPGWHTMYQAGHWQSQWHTSGRHTGQRHHVWAEWLFRDNK